MPPSLSPQAFVAKWRRSELKESAADREHFIDLCRLIGHETPAEADSTGATFTFQYGAAKLDGKHPGNRVQFPVLQKNQRRLRFGQRGKEVPVRTVHGELMADEGHEKFAAMVPPFTPVDRGADYRAAQAHFSALDG